MKLLEKEMDAVYRIIAFISVLLPFLRGVRFIPVLPNAVYYGFYCILAILIILHKKIRINISILLIIVFCCCSNLLNNIPEFYHSWERLGCFVIMLIAVGPTFTSWSIEKMRIIAIKYAGVMSVIITMLSFGLYLVAPSLSIVERGNIYGGITIHSMLISPISALSMLYLIQYAFARSHRIGGIRRAVVCVMAFISLLSCILAASRAALAALALSFVVWLWLRIRPKWYAIVMLTFILLLGVCTSPIWFPYTESINKKMEYSNTHGSILVTRAYAWGDRFEEFKANPIFGCGFNFMNLPKHKSESKTNGTIEPGNSWLFILSSCGLGVFILITGLYLKAMWNLWVRRSDASILLLSFLVFFMIHMMAEGYMLSAGNPLFVWLWLTISVALGWSFSDKEIQKNVFPNRYLRKDGERISGFQLPEFTMTNRYLKF